MQKVKLVSVLIVALFAIGVLVVYLLQVFGVPGIYSPASPSINRSFVVLSDSYYEQSKLGQGKTLLVHRIERGSFYSDGEWNKLIEELILASNIEKEVNPIEILIILYHRLSREKVFEESY